MQLNKTQILLLIALAAIVSSSHADHHCQHGNLTEKDFDQSVYPTMDQSFQNQDRNLQANLQSNLYEADRNLQTAKERPFKITYDFSFFNTKLSSSVQDGIFKQKVEQVMQISVQYFSNLLRMIPRPSGSMKWTLEKNVCGGGNLLAKIPAVDRIDDKDTDMHIYLVFVNEPTQEYVAYAGACRELPGLGTTHAQITFNQAWFAKQDLTSDKIFQDMQGTVFHEIIHVLGFSEKSYTNWIDSTTKKPYQKVTVTQKVRGFDVKFIQTPNVKKVAQEYYGCSTLVGMPLENQGSAGSAGSHWEATLMVDEMMKSTVIKTNFYLSPFTLALLKDTGFYSKVNDEMADDYFYGKDASCDFVMGECDATKNNSELCTKETEKTDNQCDFYNTGVSYCESSKFFDPKCFQRVVDDRGRCFDLINNSKSSALYTKFYGQYFGENSKCFMSTVVQKIVGSTYSLQASCYKYECIKESNQLKIYAGAESSICSLNGEKITFKGYDGYIVCPEKIDQFCQFKKFCPSYCSGNGYCMKGNCVCLSQFEGNSCQTQKQG